MSDKPRRSAQEHASSFTKKQRTIALIVVSLAFVMDLLDGTIVNVAIPSIQSNLGASYATIQWLIAGYALSFALLLVTGGRMGDVFGYKKLFMIGVGGFTLASLLSGIAMSPNMLIGARLLQGSMAALMVPQVMSLMQVMYKPSERGSVNGLFGALGGLAASLGPVVGGLLIKLNIFGWDWRPIFLINVPVGIVGLWAAAKYLPDGKSPHPLKLDITGTVIIMIAMTLLVFPLIEGREMDWPTWTYAMIAASVPVFVLFAWWQKVKDKKDGSALILPSLFKRRAFTAGLLTNIIFEAAMLGFFLTFTLLLQIGLGFSPIHAALTGLPVAIAIAVTMGTVGGFLPRFGGRAMAAGTIVMATGLATISLVAHHYAFGVHSWQFIPGLFLVGVGMGMIFGTMFAAVLNGVDPHHAGSASGILNAVQQVGGAIGIALIGVIFFGQISHASNASFDSITPQLKSELSSQNIPVQGQDVIVASVKQCFVDRSHEKDPSTVPASCSSLQTQTGTGQSALADIISKQAMAANAANFDHAFRIGVIYEIGLLAVTFGLSFMLPRKFKPEAMSEI